jgi:hypothetical protein
MSGPWRRAEALIAPPFVDFEHPTGIIDNQLVSRFLSFELTSINSAFSNLASKLGQGQPEHAGLLRKIFKTDVFVAPLDLADVRPVEPADMGELLLGPDLGRAKIMDPLAQKYQ